MGPRDLAARRNALMRCVTTGVRAAGESPTQSRMTFGIPWNTRLRRCFLCARADGDSVATDRLALVERKRQRNRKWRAPKCWCRVGCAELPGGSVWTTVRRARPDDDCDWRSLTVLVLDARDDARIDAWKRDYRMLFRADIAARVDDAIGVQLGERALTQLIADYAA
jgi:hypothetical protein